MLLDPYDVLDQLAEFLDSTLAWCDVEGEYGTGMHSFSSVTITKMRRCVDASIMALAMGRKVKFPGEMDCMAYLVLRQHELDDGCERLEVV